MRRLLTPRMVVPLLFGAVIIAVLLGWADVDRVLHAASAFQPPSLLLLFALALAYQAVRAIQWFLLLRVLQPSETWRGALMAYLGGELAKSLPGGQYVQTYLLCQAEGVPVAHSAVATTFILWLKVVVSLAILLLLGIGPWVWVRPVCVLLLGGIALVALGIKRRPFSAQIGRATQAHRRLHAAWAWIDDFSRSVERLLAPRVLVSAAVLSTGYLACSALACIIHQLREKGGIFSRGLCPRTPFSYLALSMCPPWVAPRDYDYAPAPPSPTLVNYPG